jgi:hypothetical protein
MTTTPMGEREELAEYFEKECNRYANGECMTLRCQKRGYNYQRGAIPCYTLASCEEHEAAVIIRASIEQSRTPPPDQSRDGELGPSDEILIQELLDAASAYQNNNRPTANLWALKNARKAVMARFTALRTSTSVIVGEKIGEQQILDEAGRRYPMYERFRRAFIEGAGWGLNNRPVIEGDGREGLADALAERFPETLTPYGSGKTPSAFAYNVADFVLALRLSPAIGGARRWKHKKRGTSYTEIARGSLQSNDPGGLSANEPMVVYRGDDGKVWIRDATEFEDGRFEALPPGETGTMSENRPFVSMYCEGERCNFEGCSALAEHKIEETIFDDDPLQPRHELTAYVCHSHFRQMMGPAADHRVNRYGDLLPETKR